MPRQATIRYAALRTSLVNLPLSLYAPLVEHQARPQGVAVQLSATVHGKRVTVYLGWSGLASASSLAQWQQRASSSSTSTGRDASFETVEIDPQLAASLGLPENTVVDTGLLHDLPVASRVFAEPVSADDWEIMEMHAGYMEDSLLSQVRVAVVGQEVDAWVLGRTRVRFKIVSTEPEGGPCLLSTNTEVAIAPKSRSQQATAPTSRSAKPPGPPVVQHTPGTKSTSTLSPADALRVLPASLLQNFIPPSTTVASVIVTPRHPLAQETREAPLLVRVTVHRPPFARKKEASNAGTEAPGPKILKPNDGINPSTTAAQETARPKWHLARLYVSNSVPAGHAVCLSVPSAEDWDIISLALASTGDGEPGPAINWPTDPVQALPPLAGVSSLLDSACATLSNMLALHATTSASPGLQGLLLVGRPGSGRSSVAHAIASRLREDQRFFARTVSKDMASFGEDRVAVVKAEWTSLLEKAAWSSPAIIVLDNLDVLIGVELEHADSSRQRQLAEQFVSVFGRNGRRTPGVVLLATAKSTSTLHPLLSSSAAHIFGSHLTLTPPNRDARRDILAHLVRQHITQSDLSLDMGDPINYVALATTTEGYSASDLKDLVAGAVGHAAMRETLTLGARDLEKAQREFVPLSLRDVQQGKRAEVRWSDIGGLHETRRVLRETLEWPTKYGPIFAECPLRLRSGLLLYGFPGCGKTLLASAVARECGLNFIGVKGPELLNKYIGASEQSVRELFERASAAKPCVLFFDEFDSIAPKRGHDSTGVTDRVVNQLLTQMDGAEGLDGVYVLAATSRPDLIDPALLRPGRLDKALLCGMPDEVERHEILDVVARKLALDAEVDLSDYAGRTAGFSSADLQALLYNAHLDAIHESITERPVEANLHNGKATRDGSSFKVVTLGASGGRAQSKAEEQALQRRVATMIASSRPKKSSATNSGQSAERPHVNIHDGHLAKAFSNMKPSLPADEYRRLATIYGTFQADRAGELPTPSTANGIGQRVSLM